MPVVPNFANSTAEAEIQFSLQILILFLTAVGIMEAYKDADIRDQFSKLFVLCRAC